MASGVHHRPADGASNRSRTVVAVASGLLLLALAAVGCSTSPDNDESNGAIEEPTPTTEAAQPVEQTQPDSPPATTLPPQPPQPDPRTTAEPDQPEEQTSQSDQTDPSGTVTDGDTSGVGADDALSQSYGNINRSVSPGVVPALLPWGDGLLEYGYPATSEHQWDRTRLLIRVSAGGLDWSPFEPFPVPFADLLIDDAPTRLPIRDVASDGKRLLFAVQQGDEILVAITRDLTNWETIEISPPPTDGLPYGVQAQVFATHLAIGPSGWLLHTRIELGVDPWEIAPADIRESARYIRLGDPDYVGGELVGPGGSQGLEIRWETEQQEPGEPLHRRFVTWEELGIDEDTYRHYGIANFANKPYTPTWLTSGAVWVAAWGDEPFRAILPEMTGGECCAVVGTDAGYVGLPRLGEPGYLPYAVTAHPMFFSSDGSTWVAIDSPRGARVSLLQLSAVENGILVAGDVSGSPEPYVPIGSRLWLGDATGSDWRSVALPGLPERSWLSLRDGGYGTAGVGGLPEGDWSAQWILGSVDGVNWLVKEDSAAGDMRMMAINGDVMVGIDRQGNVGRFLIP